MRYFLQVTRKSLLPSIFLLIYSQASAQVLARTKFTSAANQAVSAPSSTVTLRDVLIQLKARYQVNILFEDRLVNQPVNPSLVEGNATLEQNLIRILQPSELRFKKVSEGVYVIVKKQKAKNNSASAAPSVSESRDVYTSIPSNLDKVVNAASEGPVSKTIEAADDKVIQGRIVDEKGEALPGVSIVMKGSQRGTTTNTSGEFKLVVPDNSAILVFSFVGYMSQEIVVGNKTKLDVTLLEDKKTLEEVVVIGYGTAKKEDLTGAIASVNLANSRNIPNSNVVQSLRGTVAGVVITDNGRPGSDASIQIRGRNSISGSNAPLIVLDGVIYSGGTLSDINPGDIESIHILKDASSTAIYGSLAANGVIEVTTKKGVVGKPQFNVNAYYGFSDYAHVPAFLNADQYLTFRKAAEAATGGPIPFSATEQANIAAGRSIKPFEEIRQAAPTYSGEMSVSGKTEQVSYFLSGFYTKAKSPVAGDNFGRIGGRINLNVAATSWLNLGLNSGYSIRDNTGIRADLGAASYLSPWASLYYEDGVPRKQPQDVGLVANPLFSTLWDENQLKHKTLFTNTFAEATLAKGLTYKLNLGYTQKRKTEFIYRNSYNRDAFFNLGSGSKDYFESENLTLENILQFTRNFNRHHQIVSTLMYGFYESKDESSTLGSKNIFNDALGWNALEIGDNFSLNTGAGKSTQLSAMGRFGYRYKGKYILDMSLRRDGYSAFGKDKKYGVFPAFGLSWNASEEPFLSDVRFLDNLKLRASWGKNGNRGVDRYAALSTISSTNYVFGDGAGSAVGLYPSSFANPNLGWETTTSTNLGIDFSVYKSRLNGSINYYVSQTTDLLLRQQIPNTNGYDSFLRNVGKTQNTGLEVSLNSTNLTLGSFSWGSSAAFTLNRNKILKLTGNDLNQDGIEDDDIANKWFIGHPLGSNFDYVFDGIYQTGDDFSALAGSRAGDIKFKDVDGDGAITPSDRQVIHSNQPDFILGLTNTFSYKGFNLLAVLNWRQGGYSPNSALNIGRNFYYEANIYNVPYWTKDNPINDWPAINYGNPLGYGYYQSRTFLRLQDVSLGYTFPKNLVRKAGINNLNIYLSGKNLVTWTNWIGWDPEHGAGGISPGSNGPLMRSYTVGLNLQF